jgi:hypothetical protein
MACRMHYTVYPEETSDMVTAQEISTPRIWYTCQPYHRVIESTKEPITGIARRIDRYRMTNENTTEKATQKATETPPE